MALEHRDLPLKILEMSPCSTRKRANNWIPAEWILRGGVVERCFKVSDSALGRDRLDFNAFSQRCRRPGPIIHQRWEEPSYFPVSSNMVSWKIPISFNEFLIKTYY